jgi:hypothetical protein
MRSRLLTLVAAVGLGTSAFAQLALKPHASQDQALALLRHHYIYQRSMQLVSADWSEERRLWIIKLRLPDESVITWTVDAEAKKYWYVHRDVKPPRI